MTHTNGISSSNVLQGLLGQSDRLSAVKKDASTVQPSAAAAADRAQLSSAGSTLAQVGSSSSDVRTDKVASIQSAIAAGTYSVPASDVADKLIQSLLG